MGNFGNLGLDPTAFVPTSVSLWGLGLLIVAAFVAGFVDAIAGGGGLLTVPALMLAGLSPVAAIATNKLQTSFGIVAATHTFYRAGRLERGTLLPFLVVGFAGGVTGAAITGFVPQALLRMIIPFLLISVALYVLFGPKFRQEDAKARMRVPVFLGAVAVPIALYDGAFGPGAGMFYMVGLITLTGFGLMRAIAHTKLLNVASNLGALSFFLASGHVLIGLGIAMGAANALGGYLGAKAALRFGSKLVRPLVVVMALALAMRLLFT